MARWSILCRCSLIQQTKFFHDLPNISRHHRELRCDILSLFCPTWISVQVKCYIHQYHYHYPPAIMACDLPFRIDPQQSLRFKLGIQIPGIVMQHIRQEVGRGRAVFSSSSHLITRMGFPFPILTLVSSLFLPLSDYIRARLEVSAKD